MNLFGWISNKDQRKDFGPVVNSIDGVVEWIKDRPPEDQERIMYGIVRKVYGGKIHLHANPTRKEKVAG